jgi:cysteine desulfurase/selenocysteine lyase
VHGTGVVDVERVRAHFDFPLSGRVVTNNAATTQPPRALLELHARLARDYDNVHRGQSAASRVTTERFEAAYDTIADWLGAPSRRSIALYRGTTEAHNAVMYPMLSELRDGDNVVTTMLEHNSNFVPWHAMCRELLPRFGRRVELRLTRFDLATGALDLDHLASLVDARTALVCCTGGSNFLGTKPDLAAVRAIASESGYVHGDGSRGSLLLVDGAQFVPSSYVDVGALDVDYLSFSFHKCLAPFGVGVLFAKEHLLERGLPYLFGGDMIGEGQVFADSVGYGDLPWKYAAGTPNVLGTIASAQGLRLLLDLVGDVGAEPWFGNERRIGSADVRTAMGRVGEHTAELTSYAHEAVAALPGATVYGPPPGEPRTPLVAFNVADHDPRAVAAGLDALGVESRAGCHCATLAHQALRLDPPGSCRLSFTVYSSRDDVDRALDALRHVIRTEPAVLARAPKSAGVGLG